SLWLHLPPPPSPTLFPYTTLFRSRRGRPRIWRVLIFVLAAIFFIGPLAAAFKYSLQQDNGGYGFANYGQIIKNHEIRTPLVTSRSEEHTSELQSRENLVCRLLLEK